MSRCIDADALMKCIPSEEYCSRFAVANAPTIEPQRKKGKWIPVTNGRGGFECDQCHNYAPSYQDGVEWLSGFCPNCGAEMEGQDDSI